MTQGKKPYIQMFSIHGLVRAENMELGRDADTGGQIKYVVELGRHLSRRNDIGRVDLFTRLIADKAVSEDYAAVEEKVTDKFSIIRIQCGGRKYKRKELLWPHLDEYVDRAIKRYRQNRTVPDLVHGHYPDGGYVAMHLARIFGLPFVYTGHSLGRSKLQKLLADGMAEKEIIRKYKIDRRIKVEEDILANADLVVTSTRQEVDGQYGQYENRKIPGYCVIPPGIDIQRFHPFYHDKLSESRPSEDERFAQATMLEGLNRFFLHPDKPLILSLCRPDKRKNISGLVKAFGEDLELQAMANLAVFAGIRKDIDTMEENERDVLTQMLLLMDKYDLYGKMAIPKRHESEYQVPALYRIAAQTRGVFINPAMVEPFGLTLLEAAATGLPIVATKYGGPKDIVKNCENGLLVEPADPKKMAGALKKIITDPAFWDACSKNGIMNVRKHYTWESHAGTYAKKILPTMQNGEYDMSKDTPPTGPVGRGPVGRRLLALQSFLVTDIDNTLIGGGQRPAG